MRDQKCFSPCVVLEQYCAFPRAERLCFSCLRFLGNHLHQLLAHGCRVEDALEDPLGLVLPPDPKQVKRNPAEDDGEADPAFLWCHPEGNSNEKQASQDEENGQADVHLDGPFQLRLLVTQPHHTNDGQGHTQPVEEAEEVDD